MLQAKNVEIILTDFEKNTNRNAFGGVSDTWEKNPEDPREFCKSKIIREKGDAFLQLRFKETPDSYNGYYLKLNGADLRPYENFSFEIRGGKNDAPEIVKIELKNSKNEVGRYYIANISPYWREIKIPLKNFRGISRFDKMSELVFVLEGNKLKTTEGTFFVDNLKFTSSEEYYKNQIAKIRQEEEKKKKELAKLSQLPEDEFLDLISKKTFNYFLNEASPITGFVKDRSTLYSPSSIAATGFGLAAICIGVERGWISRKEGLKIVRKTLKNLKLKAEGKNGFFYHFIDLYRGKRVGKCELSSIDTALLLGGVIVAREYFKNREIRKLADEIYKKVNWIWMLNKKKKSVYMGWDPEKGFAGYPLWDEMSEGILLYIMGMGSPTHPLPPETWDSFSRPVKKYRNMTYIYCSSESLFVYQYPLSFVDFRNKHDKYADYWENAKKATLHNYYFCHENSDKFKTYKEGFWGLSASDGPDGYRNYGATPFTNDGTIAPYALCGAIPFVPEIAIKTLRKLLRDYGDKIWGKYGFTSAFNIDRNWFSLEYIGIDLGITLLMIENYRTGFIWKYFMKNKWMKSAMKKAGFKEGTRELNVQLLKKKFPGKKKKLKRRILQAQRGKKPAELIKLSKPEFLEFGKIKNAEDMDAYFGASWDKNFLYLLVNCKDNRILIQENQKELYKGDCVEIYLSGNPDKFVWGDKDYFQIVLAPGEKNKRPLMWAYFQDICPKEIFAQIARKPNFYSLYIKIPWSFLKINPKAGAKMGISVAVHDIDEANEKGKKVNWQFLASPQGIKLGELILK